MLEIIIILVLLVFNGLFAMSEIALVSSRRSRLQQKADTGSAGAKTALKLLAEPEKFLSTVQIGITLVGIIAGAYGGGAFSEDLQPVIAKVAFLEPYSNEIAFVIIVILITYFSLVVGELVPKRIAMNNPETITIFMAPFMYRLSQLTYPFVVFLSFSTRIVLKIFRVKEKKETPVTEEELRYLIDSSSRHGIIEKQEREIVYGVFRFGDRKAHAIMTHRTDVFWIDINMSKEKILEQVHKTHFTKFPVCDGSLDQIVGVVTAKEVLTLADTDPGFNLRSIAKEPLFIPSVLPALKVLDMFRKKQMHIGFILNEYGSVEGLITLHDMIENILGDLPEFEEEFIQIVRRDDTSWLADGEIRIDEVKRVIGIAKFPGEQSYSTLAGFIVYQLHKIPGAGERFDHEGFSFEVIDMDGNRIDKVLITKIG